MSTTNYSLGGRVNFRDGLSTRTVVFCEPHAAYYVVSTTASGESLAFPCKPSGRVIDYGDVFEVRGVSHEDAVARFMMTDPARVLARLEANIS